MPIKKRKKSQAKNNTSDTKKPPETYSHPFSMEAKQFYLSGEHVNEKIIAYFADQMVEYINGNPNVFHVHEFRILKGVPECTYMTWLEKYEYLKMRHDYCKEFLGLRREKKMASHDSKTLAHTLHLYSKEWKQANHDRANLKKIEEEGKSQPVKVIFQDYKEKDKE